MANNLLIKDGTNTDKTVKTTDNAGVHTSHVNVDSLPSGLATEATLGAVSTTLTTLNGKVPAVGQATMAASAPVVIASNQTAIPVSDNGGSITVDGTVAVSGTVPVSDGGGSITVDGTVAATQSGVWTVTNANQLALVAGSATIGSIASITTSVIPGTAATNLGKARDAVVGATDTGIATLMVRRDSPTALTPAAGDYEVPQLDSTGSQWVHPTIGTTGGSTPYKLISAASTNATSVKASAGTLDTLTAVNASAALKYLKIYNKASAPTVGTDVPVAVYPLAKDGGGVSITFPYGMALSAGIALAITGGMEDSDTTAVAVNDVAVSLTYK